MPGKGSEYRKHARRSSKLPLIMLERKYGPLKMGMVLKDISIGGIGFETDEPMDVNELFRFTLHLTERRWIDGTARVRWVKQHDGTGFLCGAEIESMNWRHKMMLKRHIEPKGMGLLRFFFRK